MKAKLRTIQIVLCCVLLCGGCSKSPIERGKEFKSRVETALRENREDDATKILEEMTAYMEKLTVKEMNQLFEAWPDGADGLKKWVRTIKSDLGDEGK